MNTQIYKWRQIVGVVVLHVLADPKYDSTTQTQRGEWHIPQHNQPVGDEVRDAEPHSRPASFLNDIFQDHDSYAVARVGEVVRAQARFVYAVDDKHAHGGEDAGQPINKPHVEIGAVQVGMGVGRGVDEGEKSEGELEIEVRIEYLSYACRAGVGAIHPLPVARSALNSCELQIVVFCIRLWEAEQSYDVFGSGMWCQLLSSGSRFWFVVVLTCSGSTLGISAGGGFVFAEGENDMLLGTWPVSAIHMFANSCPRLSLCKFSRINS
ncbi:hypothetical protein KC367_g281 [Hortaea werneckii]|nr:hypothetical protein KC367_g281 [Hortaea werneckii]